MTTRTVMWLRGGLILRKIRTDSKIGLFELSLGKTTPKVFLTNQALRDLSILLQDSIKDTEQ